MDQGTARSTSDQAAPDRDLPAPERMRDAVAAYVAGVHQAYLRQAGMLAPGIQGRLPLVSAGSFSVAAVGTRYLHLVATRERLGAATAGSRGAAASVEDAAPPLAWTLWFFDPVILPSLGLVDEGSGPAPHEVRRVLGIRTTLYHLSLTPPAELAPHHAGHAGAGLAGSHAAASREHERIRAAVGEERVSAALEFEGADVAGLRRAAALLARELAPTDPDVARLAGASAPDVASLRQAVLRSLRAPGAVAARSET